MDPYLLVGPPGSGKTSRMLRSARDVASAGGRVLWVGLPAQRSHVLRLATEEGPLLGFEFLTPQQLAYRLLSDARRLRPLLTGTGRLALVGEALLADRSHPPTPGEARLFARAIAEAKRHGLTPDRIPGRDPETARLRRVFVAYERLKDDAWDYDDFRLGATTHLEEEAADDSRAAAGLDPDLVILDGFREISPPDARLVRALARRVPVRMALAAAPPGARPDEVLPARADVEVRGHLFPNPVAEARWVLRDVKAELAAGADPLDLAVIVPPGRARAVAALAEEFGVPLMDETPRGLTDRPEGRRLLSLLELPEHPTATRLLAVPELHRLGVAALDAGVAGRDAILALARERGEESRWLDWLDRLEVPERDEMPWGEALVDHALDAVRAEAFAFGAAPGPDDEERWREEERFREHALQRLAEARRVATGTHVRAWWAALLQETVTYERPDAGVALLHPVQASGRRFRRAWLLGASDGAYGTGEREDYFVPEDLRSPLADAFARARLPRRFLGRGEAEFAELRARGDVTIVTAPEGDQGGRVTPDAALLGPHPTLPPPRPAGSRLELAGVEPYRQPEGAVPLGGAEVEVLGRYARCPFRHWAEGRLDPDDDERPAWAEVRRALTGRRRWTAADLRALAAHHPAFGPWLEEHAEDLARFSFGVELREGGDGPRARLDAARREDGEAVLVRLAAPGAATSEADAQRILDARSREYWAAAYLFEHHGRRVRRVHLWVWPIGGAPVPFPARGLGAPWGRMKRVRRDVGVALADWREGNVAPRPGWICRDCGVFDVCREGRR